MEIFNAQRIAKPPFYLQKKTNELQALGIRYERKLKLELETLEQFDVYHNPWFVYNTSSYCCLDFILFPTSEELPLICIESKLKYTADGTNKLKNLYIPVVRAAFKLDSDPIGVVIAKILTPEVKNSIHFLHEAKANNDNVMMWMLNGRISW